MDVVTNKVWCIVQCNTLHRELEDEIYLDVFQMASDEIHMWVCESLELS